MGRGHSCFGGPLASSRAQGCLPGIRSSCLIAGIAASAITLASMSAGAPSSDPESAGRHVLGSLVATIHSEIGEYRASTSAQIPGVRLASLHTDGTTDSAFAKQPAADRSSFDARFNSSFGARFLSFDERFGAATKGDREPTATRSVQQPDRLQAAEPARDNLARPETPKGRNARQAVLAPAVNTSVGATKPKPTLPDEARGDAILASLGSRTAIYDISARVVYLPNGENLEAHSGFAELMDDPRSVGVKQRGVTPPNIYELSMRERLFHGVRAVRLTPVDPDRMFGRAGMLAHSYLLGPNGQSNGCVSISDYPRFLDAFLNGEIERLVVVDRLVEPPSPNTAVGWLAQRVKAFFKSS
jgi:hypothetical protein